jgi:hypothetical protein
MYKHVFGVLAPLMLIMSCQEQEPPPAADEPEIPRGYVATLQLEHKGQLYRFGPFVGYYFHASRPDNVSTLDFICFNERRFYASDMPINAELFAGEAVLQELKSIPEAVPSSPGRIRPVFFDGAPAHWLNNRPRPHEHFIHFHSAYNDAGVAFMGYWLKHRGLSEFTYDMGGRVSSNSPLFHKVRVGTDLDFPRIIEFDFGPKSSTE